MHAAKSDSPDPLSHTKHYADVLTQDECVCYGIAPCFAAVRVVVPAAHITNYRKTKMLLALVTMMI
jgi:hypothetical protein